VTYPIVFLAIVAIAMLVAQVVGRVASEVMQVTFFGMFDQIGGAAAGLVKGMLWISIAITIVMHLGLDRHMESPLRQSNLVGPLSRLLPAAFTMVRSYAKDAPLSEPFHNAAQSTTASR
jgi:hypothetical protein